MTSHTCRLNDAQAEALRVSLAERNYRFREVPYARFAAEKDKTSVVFYESGKLVVQGKGHAGIHRIRSRTRNSEGSARRVTKRC